MGASHAEVGAYLLGLWGLPDPIVEAVLYHHEPELCHSKLSTPLTAVYLANNLLHGNCQIGDELNQDYLNKLGITDLLPRWQKKCRQLQADDQS